MSPATPGPLLAECSQLRSSRFVCLCVIADPHVSANGTGTWKMAHRSEALFSRAVATVNRHEPTLTLLASDLTSDGRPESFTLVNSVLEGLESPWVAVPGNHDVPKAFDEHEPPATGFEHRYAELPTVVDAGPVSVLALNTASAPDRSLRSTWGGRVSEHDRAWLADTLETVAQPLVLCHHNVGALLDAPGGKFEHFQLQDAPAATRVLTDHDVPLVLTGHHHVPAVTAHGMTTEVLAPAICSYPQAMLVVDIEHDGTTVRLVPLATQSEIAAARAAAVTGKPLAQGIATLVDRRMSGFINSN